MKTLQNKVAIITGGGRGIGFGLAKAFAKAGANLVITGRNRNTLHNAKEKLESQYQINVLCIPADGANEDDVNNVINKTIKYYGKINIVVNNAQASKSGVMLKDHTKEDFDLAINSGLYATFFYMRAAYPYLKESHGSVINFASGAGLFGKLGQSSYATAKEGIRGLRKSTLTYMKKLFKVFQCNALLILKMTLEVQQSFLLAKPVTTLPEKL